MQSVLNGTMPQDLTCKLASMTKFKHYKQNMVEDLHADTTQLLERYFWKYTDFGLYKPKNCSFPSQYHLITF